MSGHCPLCGNTLCVCKAIAEQPPKPTGAREWFLQMEYGSNRALVFFPWEINRPSHCLHVIEKSYYQKLVDDYQKLVTERDMLKSEYDVLHGCYQARESYLINLKEERDAASAERDEWKKDFQDCYADYTKAVEQWDDETKALKADKEKLAEAIKMLAKENEELKYKIDALTAEEARLLEVIERHEQRLGLKESK